MRHPPFRSFSLSNNNVQRPSSPCRRCLCRCYHRLSARDRAAPHAPSRPSYASAARNGNHPLRVPRSPHKEAPRKAHRELCKSKHPTHGRPSQSNMLDRPAPAPFSFVAVCPAAPYKHDAASISVGPQASARRRNNRKEEPSDLSFHRMGLQSGENTERCSALPLRV